MKHSKRKNIKVMHLIETLDPGGAESVMAEMIKHMPGFVTSIVCCLKQSGAMAKKLKGYVKSIHELNKGEGNELEIIFRIARLACNEKIDILHAHNWNTFCEGIFAAMLARKPIINTIHGHHLLYPKTVKAFFKKKNRHLLERILSYRSKKICTVSVAISEYVAKEIGIDKKRIEVLINGVDTKYTPHDPFPSMSQMGIDTDDFIVCFSGRLMPIKNIESLLDAMRLVFLQYKKIKLLIIGDGPERNRLENKVIEYGIGSSVIFSGFRCDVRDILPKVHLFVLPSLYEGISIALLEAMSAGLPSIVTDVGGNKETVLNNETGLLYSSGESKDLANHIIRLYRNPLIRKEMGENARKRANQLFSINNVANKYAQFYIDCVR